MSPEIRTAEILAEGMRVLHEEIFTDLELARKRQDFQEAIQILLAEANAVQGPNDVLALSEKIYLLADGTPELKAYLFGPAPVGKSLDFTDLTEEEIERIEAKGQNSRQVAAGICQDLFVLVDEGENPSSSDKREGLFQKLLAKLGRLVG